MPTIHPKARTTPAVRAEIARSTEPTGVVEGGAKSGHPAAMDQGSQTLILG